MGASRPFSFCKFGSLVDDRETFPSWTIHKQGMTLIWLYINDHFNFSLENTIVFVK